MKAPTINRALFPLKIVLFCWYGASSSLIPYMTIHMKELGITVEETAIIYTFLPVTQLFCTPLAGMIADKLGRYKDVLMLSVLSSVAFATAILFVPPAPDPRVEHPDIDLHCSPVVLPHVVVEKCWGGPCNVFYTNQSNPMRLEGCSVYCPGLINKEFSAADELCNKNDSHCFIGNDLRYPLIESNFTLRLNLRNPYPERNTCLYPVDGVTPVLPDYTYSEENILQSICPVVVNKAGSNCTIKCSFLQLPDDENGTFPHINRCVRTTGNRVLTFWLYFILRILFNIFASICLTLLDATALAMVEAHGGQYGRQRFWAILAQAIFSPVTGFLVDLLSEHKGYMDYSPAFHFYNVLAVCTAIAVWCMSVDVPPPAENVIKNFRKLLKVPPVIALMVVVFWLGAMWGFVESFLFWYLLDLGSPNFLLGLTLTTGAVVGLPFLYESDWFVRKAGQVNLLLLALLFYFIRFFGYSYIHNPWWCIPFEAMEAFTYHLMWVAAATYGAELAPQGLLATIQGCVGGLHYGVGRGSGSFAGGTLMSHFGARLAFRVMGIAAGVMLFVYGLVYYGWLRKRGDRDKRKPVSHEVELSSGNIVSNNAAEVITYTNGATSNQDQSRLEIQVNSKHMSSDGEIHRPESNENEDQHE
ncbi:major facilitator superfamily domain-containing protein 6-like [Uloborus diversus]|uniref:major facilitator superfamily domain-containing protein 6-like n=1 Tax=Uloborus diversus TaxID=327109 RepID=UPI00240975AF|nr:major facilitator superfamily domain-containing protein 6-like [Uloborus diversus]